MIGLGICKWCLVIELIGGLMDCLENELRPRKVQLKHPEGCHFSEHHLLNEVSLLSETRDSAAVICYQTSR